MPKLDSTDLLIVLLYAPGRRGAAESIDGVTRLQKLVFLLQQGVGPRQLVEEAQAYGYQPYKMGPYSRRLRDEVEELRSAGIVQTERLVYVLNDDADDLGDVDSDESGGRGRRVESMRFSLTPLGQQIGKDLWASLAKEQRDGFAEFKGFFNSLSLRQLLIFTYERFPKFTTESTIKQQLGLA